MRELQQVTTTVPDAAKRCRFYRVELLNGGKDGRSGKGGKVRSKSKVGGKYLLNKKAQNKQKRSKGWICGYNCEKWKHGESG